ncbi:hypothetical protein ABIC83_002865 [Roseateles asaccharophilus]|uniref:hypothetical protein n=1 Tax=Roseateles asaccharophilus TaxID=582607 RepID=UPI00383409C9
MKLRFPREEISASLATVRTVDPTLEAIAAELTAEWAWMGSTVTAAELQLMPSGVEEHTGWNAHTLLLNGRPVAITDGGLDV